MPQELGAYSKARKATSPVTPKRQVLLLEEVRVRNLQAYVPLHLQNLKENFQDY
jgi:hypothetical protein